MRRRTNTCRRCRTLAGGGTCDRCRQARHEAARAIWQQILVLRAEEARAFGAGEDNRQ